MGSRADSHRIQDDPGADQPGLGIIRDQVRSSYAGISIGPRETVSVVVIPEQSGAEVVGIIVDRRSWAGAIDEAGAVDKPTRVVRIRKPMKWTAIVVPRD